MDWAYLLLVSILLEFLSLSITLLPPEMLYREAKMRILPYRSDPPVRPTVKNGLLLESKALTETIKRMNYFEKVVHFHAFWCIVLLKGH
jgi:hypothetical protein